MDVIKKIALGGGCHWCTEAVFQSLRGVVKVDQGFVEQESPDSSFSEAVIVTYDCREIGLKDLVEIHLHTHKSTVAHSMRNKYRSAIYVFEQDNFVRCKEILKELQADFDHKLVTQVYNFKSFRPSAAQFHNYYFSDPGKPFCTTYIVPKLKLLMEKFSALTLGEKSTVSLNRESI